MTSKTTIPADVMALINARGLKVDQFEGKFTLKEGRTVRYQTHNVNELRVYLRSMKSILRTA